MITVIWASRIGSEVRASSCDSFEQASKFAEKIEEHDYLTLITEVENVKILARLGTRTIVHPREMVEDVIAGYSVYIADCEINHTGKVDLCIWRSDFHTITHWRKDIAVIQAGAYCQNQLIPSHVKFNVIAQSFYAAAALVKESLQFFSRMDIESVYYDQEADAKASR